MSYEDFLMSGIQTDQEQRKLWDIIKMKNPSHNDLLEKMRDTQQSLSLYSKGKSYDGIQGKMLSDIKFLETMAWRVYMFGYSNLLLPNPGLSGEYAKRMRNDPSFHKMLDTFKLRFGPPGCNYPQILFFRMRKCAVFKCKHTGAKQAVKKLKSKMRQEWEDTFLKKYSY